MSSNPYKLSDLDRKVGSKYPMDWVDHDLFDKVTIEGDNPGRVYKLFSYPLRSLPGWAGIGIRTEINYNDIKDEVDTNMYMCCQLPAPEVFIIDNLIVHSNRDMRYIDVAYADRVWSNYAIMLSIKQKQMFHTPLTRFPMMPDYRQLWKGNSDNESKLGKWILPRPVHFTLPLIIPYGWYFYDELIKTHKEKSFGLGRVDVTVTLNGRLGRGVK